MRSGKLKSSEMQGGTFTVNNTGSFGSVQSMGIINYPQAAILQVESIVKRPVVMAGGMIGVRDMVNLCLSLDHRVLDGLVCRPIPCTRERILENISAEQYIYLLIKYQTPGRPVRSGVLYEGKVLTNLKVTDSRQ